MTSGCFSDDAVDQLNGISCIDHPTDSLRIVKYRDEMIPMAAQLLGNARVFPSNPCQTVRMLPHAYIFPLTKRTLLQTLKIKLNFRIE